MKGATHKPKLIKGQYQAGTATKSTLDYTQGSIPHVHNLPVVYGK